jgi:hypothetical protein
VCILLTPLVAILGGCSQAKPIDTQITVIGGQVYRISIYAEKGQTITGSWKPDKFIYNWWTSPGGSAYYPFDYMDQPVEGRREVAPPGGDGKDVSSPGFLVRDGNITTVENWGWLRGGGLINIECDISGFYTLCFYLGPLDTNESTSVNIHYEVK